MWSGWVGIALKTGFGLVSPLPGIWPLLHMDTAITLPIGVDAYAAYALGAWLASDARSATGPATSQRVGDLFVRARYGRACRLPRNGSGRDGTSAVAITTIVSCVPVLGMAWLPGAWPTTCPDAPSR